MKVSELGLLLAVFIEWKKDGHEKFEYIGIYTNDTAKIFTEHARKVANHLGLKEYSVVALLSEVNKLHPDGLEKYDSLLMAQSTKSRSEIIEVSKTNNDIAKLLENFNNETTDTFKNQLERFKNFSQTKEDAEAILKDAEKI